jgi:WD40-like Beta Propeller Repeat
MRLVLSTSVIVCALLSLTRPAWAESEIVIAMRYLQAEGTSHSHLYLYREDGKLLRQLTNDNSGQDSGPIFSPDGETIVFTREKPYNVRELWSIKPRGTNLKRLAATPDWYAKAKSSPYFTNEGPYVAYKGEPQGSPAPPPTFKTPDETMEIVLREDPTDKDDQDYLSGHGKHYLLRNLKTGTEIEFGKIPGFLGAIGLLHENLNKDGYFLFEGALRLAFVDLHLNSTDGDTVFALDLSGPRLVSLSPNWATPIALPGEGAFLTFAENRYVPIPGSKKTANCSYIERWDNKLNHIRYAVEKSAALCYGFSMYRLGLTPATITMRRSSN